MKVILGQHEGDTGLIVRVENTVAVLVSDLTLHEVCKVKLIHLILKQYLLSNVLEWFGSDMLVLVRSTESLVKLRD